MRTLSRVLLVLSVLVFSAGCAEQKGKKKDDKADKDKNKDKKNADKDKSGDKDKNADSK